MSGDSTERPKIPLAATVYGEIVYWVTILAAIVCMVGPFLAVSDVENNLLNPHYVFAHIFNQEEPGGVWALSANKEPELPVQTKNVAVPEEWGSLGVRKALEVLAALPVPAGEAERPEMVVGEDFSILRNPEAHGEQKAFTLVARSKGKAKSKYVTAVKARAKLLDRYKDVVVKDGHFWMKAPFSGDGFTQFGLALGCSVALWGLIAAAFLYLRQKVILYTGLALWVALLVFISAAGMVQLH